MFKLQSTNSHIGQFTELSVTCKFLPILTVLEGCSLLVITRPIILERQYLALSVAVIPGSFNLNVA